MNKESKQVELQDGNFCAVYGSLRSGCYNGISFGFNEKTLKVPAVRIPGYKMYSLSAYPYILESEDENDSIVIEVFECSDEIFRRVTSMEIGAGYVSHEILISGEDGKVYPCTIYVYDNKWHYQNAKQVVKGDWVEYINDRSTEKV